MSAPDRVIKVFVSYSHANCDYLQDDSLLGFLKGFEKEQVEFWSDQHIRAGESWHEVIKANIQDADIALVLVSQPFLDSDYCQNEEIQGLLACQSFLLPVILSPCEWRRHEWLRSRQCLPGGDETILEHYTDPGRRERLFLDIRQQLRERAEQLRRTASTPPLVESEITVAPSRAPGVVYAGKTQLEFLRRLGDDWKALATLIGIPPYEQNRFERGDEGRGIWVWLEIRHRLSELPQALDEIDRSDLAEILRQAI